MQCPVCSFKVLKVSVRFEAHVTCAFEGDENFQLVESVAVDSRWTNESACECVSCSWAGYVFQAKRQSGIERIDS